MVSGACVEVTCGAPPEILHAAPLWDPGRGNVSTGGAEVDFFGWRWGGGELVRVFAFFGLVAGGGFGVFFFFFLWGGWGSFFFGWGGGGLGLGGGLVGVGCG